jgi:hypothetical protein
LFLRFRTADAAIARFNLSYEQLEAGGCGGHVIGFQGAISAPQYPHRDAQSMALILL